MKKALLLSAWCVVMNMHNQMAFAKCNAWIQYHYLSEGITGSIAGYDSTMSLRDGDTIRFTFSWSGVCDEGTIVRDVTVPGTYYFQDTINICPGSCPFKTVHIINSVTGINALHSNGLPFPLSALSSDINPGNLRYTIINALGKIIKQGTFSGVAILRNDNSVSLEPGIYMVIYSDAADNRQLLTDKVMVNN
jgi:hypothetical protein